MKIEDLRHLIDMHFDKEEYRDAMESCVALVNEHQDDMTFDDIFKKGLCHFKLEENAEAIGCFNKALEIEPDNVLALANKGTCLYSLGQTDEAFQIFGQALKIDPSVFPAWYYIGMHYLEIYSKTGEMNALQKVITCYRQVVNLAPDFGSFPIYDPVKKADYSMNLFLMLHSDVADMPLDKLIAA